MFLIIEFCHIFVCSALFFPPVEKRLSLPPRLTPLSTNNFVRCTLQNRIIKSLFSKIRRKNKNKKKHIVQASYEKQQQIFPCNNNKTKQCLCTTFSLSHYFSLIQKFTTLSNYNDKNNQLKDVKKNNEKICDILNLLDE